MKIAIIGAGFTGLACAHLLLKKGNQVTIFEKEGIPGGLALGFKEKGWEWSLEKYYHHWFTNDTNILGLAKEIGYKVIIKRPKTSVLVDGNIYQLDSPSSVLRFPKLTILQRLRMATVLGTLRYNPFWQPLENISTSSFLPKAMGKKPYGLLWEPLLKSKFGQYIDDVSLAWFWARIKKRTSSLAYPEGGFLEFAKALVSGIEKKGGKVLFDTEVKELRSDGKNIEIIYSNDSNHRSKIFEKAVVTLPSFFFTKIAPQLPKPYTHKLMSLKGLGAINLILRLKEPFLKEDTYWLNICDTSSPIMAIVEHTNFMDKNYYNNEHIVYLGNYLPFDHPYMEMNEKELLGVYDSFLKKINPTYNLSLITCHLFKVSFAQPIIPKSYSKIIPPLKTPLQNVYLANIQQVYPWDRGTNYAVELGEKVANLIIKS